MTENRRWLPINVLPGEMYLAELRRTLPWFHPLIVGFFVDEVVTDWWRGRQ